jgi:hypothetical protein
MGFGDISTREVIGSSQRIVTTITLGSSCDSPGMSAMPGAFVSKEEFHAKAQRRKEKTETP